MRMYHSAIAKVVDYKQRQMQTKYKRNKDPTVLADHNILLKDLMFGSIFHS